MGNHIETTPQESAIIGFIRKGEENAIHREELAKLTGMRERELRIIIERLRRSGAVIASSQAGYYFPADEAELSAFVRKEERRARSIFYTLKNARKSLKDTKRQ